MKYPVYSKTAMREVKKLWENRFRGTKDAWNMIIYKLVVKNITIFVLVYLAENCHTD